MTPPRQEPELPQAQPEIQQPETTEAVDAMCRADMEPDPSGRPPLWVALGLALGPAAVLGLGRFAYALLLPPMRADLAWTYAQAGAVNTANAAGYLAGALLSARVAEWLGSRRAFAGCLVVTAVALFASSLTRDFAVLLSLRAVAGIAGAVVFVAGGGLAAAAGLSAGRERATLLLAIYFAGPGLGILLSGPLVGAVLGPAGADWPSGWIALGCGTLLAAALAAPALRQIPAQPAVPRSNAAAFPIRPLAPIFATYTLFGAGYIAYMTFIVAFVRTRGLDDAQVALFWIFLGAAAMPAAFLWGPLLSRLGSGSGVFAVMATVLAGAVLPLVASGPVAAFGSAVLFGGSFLAVVTAVIHVARQVTPPSAWTRVIGALTVAFALGQCVGPVLAGTLSDGPGGLRAGMLLSAMLLALGALVALRQRTTEQ